MTSKASRKSRIRTGLTLLALPLAIVAAEALAWWWTHPPEPEGGRQVLTYVFPADDKTSSPIAVTETVTEMLSCDRSQAGWIEGEAGLKINLNYFEWNDTSTSGLADAFTHRPEDCMAILGKKVEAFLPERRYSIDRRELVFDTTRFQGEDGRPLYIFKLSWAEGMEGLNLLREGSTNSKARQFKIKSVARRWFPRYARVMMLGVYGAQSDTEAWDLVREKVLPDLRFRRLDF